MAARAPSAGARGRVARRRRRRPPRLRDAVARIARRGQRLPRPNAGAALLTARHDRPACAPGDAPRERGLPPTPQRLFEPVCARCSYRLLAFGSAEPQNTASGLARCAPPAVIGRESVRAPFYGMRSNPDTGGVDHARKRAGEGRQGSRHRAEGGAWTDRARVRQGQRHAHGRRGRAGARRRDPHRGAGARPRARHRRGAARAHRRGLRSRVLR